MKTIAVFALCLLSPTLAVASDYEACDLVGEIRAAKEMAALEGSAAYEFEVTIVAAARAANGGERNAGDCSGHVGRPMALDLVLPTAGGVPARGDRIAFERVVDGEIGGGGSINYSFQALNPPAPAAD